MDIQTEAELKVALGFLQQGNPLEAQKIISSLFEHDLESTELVYTNKCCIFWIDSIKRLKSINDSFERSESILLEWKNFQDYISRESLPYEPAQFAVQQGFFKNALEEYKKMLEEKDPLQKAEIYKNAGICYKKLGDFENARAFLTEANNIYPNLSSVLAELADCYSLCGEDKFGKVLYREAFFADPDSIDLDFLDSELIKCLIEKTKSKGYSGKALLYWIPVYGVLGGVFNMKRELTSQEVARLKKDIYAMENEIKDPSCNSEILIPRMLNCYFWLMDHYDLANENQAKINEVLLRIKLLDTSVYEMYIK
jgi:tetratricopeptide (TPR) repeat protein